MLYEVFPLPQEGAPAVDRENHRAGVEGWSAIRQIFQDMVGEVSVIAEIVTQSIRSNQPVYSIIPEEEHRAAVTLQVLNQLRALSEQRGLGASELAAATELAAERATEGLPIEASIAAYQACDTVIWRILLQRSTPHIAALLPRIGTLMFEAASETTTAMAGAHSRVARAIDGDRITTAHQFLEYLEDPEQRSAATAIAAGLRLDTDGQFVGLVWQPDPELAELAEHRTVPTLPPHLAPNVVSRAVSGGRLEMITQTGRLPEIVFRGPAEKSLAGRWGIGLPRSGLAGASASLGDARLAFLCTSAQRPIRVFERDWHEAILLAERSRFGGLLASAIDVAGANPHLTETVLAFAAADMSIAATALAVHVHANSVTYRLDRWSQLSGLEARSFRGLCQSVIACRLASTLDEVEV